jgi:hypothetical protein
MHTAYSGQKGVQTSRPSSISASMGSEYPTGGRHQEPAVAEGTRNVNHRIYRRAQYHAAKGNKQLLKTFRKSSVLTWPIHFSSSFDKDFTQKFPTRYDDVETQFTGYHCRYGSHMSLALILPPYTHNSSSTRYVSTIESKYFSSALRPAFLETTMPESKSIPPTPVQRASDIVVLEQLMPERPSPTRECERKSKLKRKVMQTYCILLRRGSNRRWQMKTPRKNFPIWRGIRSTTPSRRWE